MTKLKQFLLATSLLVPCVVNSQSITNAWNGSPSNCDTGCAQSSIVGVSGNNSASSGVNVVYQGPVSYTGVSFTVSKMAEIIITSESSYSCTSNYGCGSGSSASTTLSGGNATAMDGCNSRNGIPGLSATVQTGNSWSVLATGHCVVPAGSYTARATGTGSLQVVELP